MTRKYIGTKEVTAWPQVSAVTGEPGYAVKYADGYVSWSPAAAFEEAYRVTEGDEQRLTFGDAIYFLKAGKKVARSGWNGKGMFLFLVSGSRFAVNRAPLLGIYPEGTLIDYLPHVDMKTATGEIVPWLASQTDILAEDWRVL